jgi:predicted nuclease of predicted toxin-antitoxin system
LDEGVPKSVLKILQNLRYDCKRVQDFGTRGISNGAVMSLASSSGRILLTRDSDFLKLNAGTRHPPKVVYLEAYRDDPDKLAFHVETFIERCLELLSQCSAVILDEGGPECIGGSHE